MTLNQTKLLSNLNLELLDALTTTLESMLRYCQEHGIPLYNEDSLYTLITCSRKILKEISDAEESTKSIKSFNPSDGFTQQHKSDEDYTEP